MTNSCGIIQDLLPLYLDQVCREESKQLVEAHLKTCPSCKHYLEELRSNNAFTPKPDANDLHIARSMKKIKKKLNKKLIFTSLAAILAVIICFQVLFHLPLKQVDLSDVGVSVNVYPIDELTQEYLSAGAALSYGSGDDAVTIRTSENDSNDMYTVMIPELSNTEINISGDISEKYDYVSVITWSSEYFLREIKYDENRDNTDGALYISDIKTTVFNNKAEEYNSKITTLQMQNISKIVHVAKDGTETVLWQAQ